jgi:hypothetical protein
MMPPRHMSPTSRGQFMEPGARGAGGGCRTEGVHLLPLPPCKHQQKQPLTSLRSSRPATVGPSRGEMAATKAARSSRAGAARSPAGVHTRSTARCSPLLLLLLGWPLLPAGRGAPAALGGASSGPPAWTMGWERGAAGRAMPPPYP